MKFVIMVTETLQREFLVLADSLGEAKDIVDRAYDSGDIVLTADDCLGKEISESLFYSREEVERMELIDIS